MYSVSSPDTILEAPALNHLASRKEVRLLLHTIYHTWYTILTFGFRSEEALDWVNG